MLHMRRSLLGPVALAVWPQGVAVRPFTPDDAEDAHALLQSGFWDGGGGAVDFRRWRSALRKDREFDPRLFFLAQDGQGVAGLVHCRTSSVIKDIAVHPRVRRHGLGRALMLTAFAAMRARDADFIDLKVREDNAAAVALYMSLDMRVVERMTA
jgi:ribosomal protein S18 acetylase RimI-like enzyme